MSLFRDGDADAGAGADAGRHRRRVLDAVHRYGGADVYWTEYFRVSATSTPEKRILDDITKNTTGRPVVAQMIGNDIPALIRTAKVLAAIPGRRDRPQPRLSRRRSSIASARVAACCASRSASTASSARCATRCRSSSRSRRDWALRRRTSSIDLLPIFARHSLDALTVHARTVAQLYRLPVHYERIRQAVDAMPCPVIANGHVLLRGAGAGAAGADRRARPDDRTRRDSQSVAVQPDPPAAARRDRDRCRPGATSRPTFARCGTRRPASTSPKRRSASG